MRRNIPRDLKNVIPYNLNRFAAKAQQSQVATIRLALPNDPVNIYLNGELMESNVSNLVDITVDSSVQEASVHQLIVQDISDRLKVNATEIELKPGEVKSVNMSDF